MRVFRFIIRLGIIPKLIGIVLSLSLTVAFLPSGKKTSAQTNSSAYNKLSPALQRSLNSNELLVWLNPSSQRVRVLVQTKSALSLSLITAITLQGGYIVREFSSINCVLVDIPKNKVLTIANRSDVERMSPDHLAQQSVSHLETATGANSVRTYQGLTYNGLDGSDIEVAVLDSGVMNNHNEFKNSLGLSRVVASTDIVINNTNLLLFESVLGLLNPLLSGNKDAYGHGTHVASTAIGRWVNNDSQRDFSGIAPNANLIDVRVLDGRGLGKVSDVLAGIDWVITNRNLYNIKVLNMSLGAASSESYETDLSADSFIREFRTCRL